MEINEDGFLEELVALRKDTLVVNQVNDIFTPTTATWSAGGFGTLDTPSVGANSSYDSFSPSSLIEQSAPGLDCTDFYIQPPLLPLPDSDTFPCNNNNYSATVLPSYNIMSCSNNNNITANTPALTNTTTTTATTKNNKVKKGADGQPSKNLMAERRRRKRLNDRLAMLRSVVPNITKMDRTSILGDTIDYMKELLTRINNLQQDVVDDAGSNQFNVLNIGKDVKPNDVLVRNTPKFDVVRRDLDTRIEICCAGKSGLLLSTLTTLEALGLDIQQCVVSCFSDFSLQASCSQGSLLLGSEDIKQALFRNAGYGGRCL